MTCRLKWLEFNKRCVTCLGKDEGFPEQKETELKDVKGLTSLLSGKQRHSLQCKENSFQATRFESKSPPHTFKLCSNYDKGRALWRKDFQSSLGKKSSWRRSPSLPPRAQKGRMAVGSCTPSPDGYLSLILAFLTITRRTSLPGLPKDRRISGHKINQYCVIPQFLRLL